MVENVNNNQVEIEESKNNSWKTDILRLSMLLGIAFVSAYFTNRSVNLLVFTGFLIAAYRSKYDYLWLAWFFILIDAPGKLFSAQDSGWMRMPLYSLGAGLSFEFQEVFLFMYIAKAYLSNKFNQEDVFKRFWPAYFAVIGAYIFFSVLLGLNFRNMVFTFRNQLPWMWLMIIPAYIRTPEDLMKVSRMFFPIAFLALTAQVYSFMFGNYWDGTLRGVESHLHLAVDDDPDQISRSYSAVYVTFYAMTMALFYLSAKQKTINPNYLGAVAFGALASMFLSATRGYILSFGFVIFATFYLVIKSGRFQRIINIILASIALIFILQWSFPAIGQQVEAASARFSTLFLLASGDVTAGGTLHRLDDRGGRVLEKYNQSPIFGWGFSNDFYLYTDGHVGHQNIMLNVGMIGYIYLNILFFHLCFVAWNWAQDRYIVERWGESARVFVFAFLAVYIIHASTSQFWGYYMYFDQTDKIMTWAFLFASVNVLAIASKSAHQIKIDEKKLQYQQERELELAQK